MKPNLIARVITAILIAGSAYAIFTLLVSLRELRTEEMSWFLYGISLSVALFSFVSGLLYWAGRSVGLYGSIAAHAIQIPMIFSTVLTYKFVFGIGLFLRVIDFTSIAELTFGESTILIVMPHQQSTVAGINLYALFALIYLVRTQTRQDKGSN